jgi:hypothetical protein
LRLLCLLPSPKTATSLYLIFSTAALKALSPAATSVPAARSAREALFSIGLKDAAGLLMLLLEDMFSFDVDGVANCADLRQFPVCTSG